MKEDVPGTIRELGFGDDKNLDTPAATLSFTAKGTGEAEVKITSAKVDIGSPAVGSDDPDAHILDTTTVISVTGYTVTRRYRGAVYHIAVDNTAAVQHGVQSITVDGKALAGNVLPLAAAGTTVQVRVTMG